jgi:plastocyanin
MKLLFARVLMLAAVLGTAGAHAAGKSHTARMEAMKFIPERLEVNAGDTVRGQTKIWSLTR